ncbi:hypothetical protein BS47DRAFT_1350585 [Hydnum rufescens UP504]|uniref:Major facilitator superfamily (MFS) profile domain-containing protein n=1 Tax=Hydnum rufescens UP504 TaxID=1448309 RepID=A0A9P6AN10_9AGAM|nr:hypothetical protein BS47DRAFT_1350585 [Hydnum rufescens UP504]
MVGNLLSAIVWMQSTTFASFMLSRAIGGISEGNVQLSIAILSDISTPETRGKALSLVGIAFGLCFCVGPPLGAYFASRPFSPSLGSFEFNIYAAPAGLSLVLLVIETAFLAYFLPETKGKGRLMDIDDLDVADDKKTDSKALVPEPEERLRMLSELGKYHFFFLAIFSGVEFTLTFLTFDLFDWTNLQNGRLLGFIGVLSTLLQGGYVRRAIAKTGEILCPLPFFLSLLPYFAQHEAIVRTGIRTLYLAAALLAFTSATVVNSLTALASLQCDDDNEKEKEKAASHPGLSKGRALGQFRSSGQLGRAIGPLLACASYWTFGPTATYLVGGGAMFILARHMRQIQRSGKISRGKKALSRQNSLIMAPF